MYFGAQADAGLTPGTLAAGLGLLFWLVIGAAIANGYDRKRFYRLRANLLAHLNKAIRNSGPNTAHAIGRPSQIAGRRAQVRQSGEVSGPFSGTTAAYYARYRRGYPEEIVSEVVDRLHLGPDDTVIDLGCGTGLLTVPVAQRVRVAIGVDPEPDMLAEARRSIDGADRWRIIWVLGSDDDIPALGNLLGEGAVGAVTVGQALHFMDHEALFRRARHLLRPGGGVAVISNGVPLWQQDNDWSRALRDALESWLHTSATSTCGTSETDRVRYRNALRHAGYEVQEAVYEYEADLTFEEIIGGLLSAMSARDVAEGQRDAFTQHVRQALPDEPSFTELVPVTALIGVAL
jgi:trans-aconitate methyltransferase